MSLPPKETLHEGRFVRLCRRGSWEFAESSASTGVVGILALTAKNEIILIEQFRSPVGCHVIELPGGLVGDEHSHATEAPALAAHRELLEETGYDTTALTPLAYAATSPGLTSETVHLFLATGAVRKSAGGGVGGEEIIVHEIPLSQVRTWLAEKTRTGALVDYRVYAALFLAQPG